MNGTEAFFSFKLAGKVIYFKTEIKCKLPGLLESMAALHGFRKTKTRNHASAFGKPKLDSAQQCRCGTKV